MHNILRQYLLAYRNKISNKLFGIVHFPHQGEKNGNILLSFLVDPFTLTPKEHYTDPHSNPWVAMEIARIFSKRGYDIDIINWNNDKFIPRKKYSVCIDLNHNLEKFSKFLDKKCIKIMHATGSYPKFQNHAEEKRVSDIEKRRGVLLPKKRTVPLTNNLKFADFIVGYGNKTVHNTYPTTSSELIPIPIPAMEQYDFPKNKNFESSRKHFLWFGGGGAILKGLDLVVETFASLPHLQLSIIGPSAYEKEFEEIYSKELNLPNITRYERPRINNSGEITVNNKNIIEIFNKCGSVIFLSASEGGSGAVVHAMQAGLYPIITPQSGIDEKAPSIVIENPTIDNIKKTVEDFSNIDPNKLKELSKSTWTFAKKYHTKEAFTKAYESFLDNVVKLK